MIPICSGFFVFHLDISSIAVTNNRLHMRGSRNFRQGGSKSIPWRFLLLLFFYLFFLVLNWLLSKKTIIFQGSRGSNIFRGGGGGGGGCQLLISYRNPYNMIFSRPPPPPPPPLDPPMLQKLLTGTDTVHLLAILLSRGKSIETLFLIFIRDDLDFHCFQNRHLYAHKQRSNNDNNI